MSSEVDPRALKREFDQLKEFWEERLKSTEKKIEDLTKSWQDYRESSISIVNRQDTLDTYGKENRTKIGENSRRIAELESMNKYYPLVERIVFVTTGMILTAVVGALIALVVVNT